MFRQRDASALLLAILEEAVRALELHLARVRLRAKIRAKVTAKVTAKVRTLTLGLSRTP